MWKKYWRVWWLAAKNSVVTAVATRYGAVFFFLGKILRLGFFVFLLYRVIGKTNSFASYSLEETIFFFLTFSLVDSAAQCLFREVYRFRSHVVNGTLDFVLLKPVNPLFRVLLGGPDVLDFITLFPLVGLTIWFMARLALGPVGVLMYGLLLINALVIALAFHVLVLGLGIVTTEVDRAMMIYRDLTGMGKIPVDVYKYPVNVALTWFLPVAVMMRP